MEITSVCPYCGKEMRDGAIPVLRDIYWCPRGEDGMLKDGFGDEKEQVWLGRAGLLGDYYTPVTVRAARWSSCPCRRSNGRLTSSIKSSQPGRKR